MRRWRRRSSPIRWGAWRLSPWWISRRTMMSWIGLVLLISSWFVGERGVGLGPLLVLSGHEQRSSGPKGLAVLLVYGTTKSRALIQSIRVVSPGKGACCGEFED